MKTPISQVAPGPSQRSINWLESVGRAIAQSDPRLDERLCHRVGERLSALMLARIPYDLAQQLLGLLPDGASYDLAALARHADGDPDRSIGYIQFVEAARRDFGSAEMEVERRIADAFLWAIGADLPADLKSDLARELPAELRSRMNLYSAHSDEEKVA